MRRFLALFVLVSLAGLGALAWLSVPSGGGGEVFVNVALGTGSRELAAALEQAGVVRSRWQFLAVRALRPHVTLQAGEYRFDRPASTWEVFDRLARGDVFYHELSVPEGYNLFDIASALGSLGLMKPEVFLQAARNPALIRDLAPAAPTLEGYLFPSTYRLTRHTTPEQVCRVMNEHFRKVWRELGGKGDVHRTVTLASLVEKETSIAQERPAVASVFENRLRIGMKLDCDPTIIYAALLENRFRGAIYRSDIENPHLYNTYQHAGLPPGPIANPGVDSLKAALAPAATGYLYFVAKGDATGAHQFSESLQAQVLAVQRYRRAKAQQAR